MFQDQKLLRAGSRRVIKLRGQGSIQILTDHMALTPVWIVPTLPPWNKQRKVLTGATPDVGPPNVRTTGKRTRK